MIAVAPIDPDPAPMAVRTACESSFGTSPVDTYASEVSPIAGKNRC